MWPGMYGGLYGTEVVDLEKVSRVPRIGIWIWYGTRCGGGVLFIVHIHVERPSTTCVWYASGVAKDWLKLEWL